MKKKIKDIVKETTGDLKKGAKKAKKYLVDDTVKDLKKIDKNLTPKKKDEEEEK